MLYSEAAYFDGAHVQHIADYQEHQRLERIRKANRKLVEQRMRERRSGSRFADLGRREAPALALVHG